MQNLFVDENAEVTVRIRVGQENGAIVARVLDDGESGIVGSEDYEVVFREPTYRDSAELADAGMGFDSRGMITVNMNESRMKRLCRLIKRWNLVDANGDKAEATTDNIENLHPSIAEAIADGLEERLGLNVGDISSIVRDTTGEV